MSERELICPDAFDSEFVFESYGVRVKVQASDPELFELAEKTARRALLNRVKVIDGSDPEHTFSIASDDDGTLFLFLNGSQLSYDTRRPRFFKFFDSMLRITIAEHAVGWVFVHAGTVGWKGKAIILPANSFGGKTTLVAELVKNGAEYYSDEYAVIGENGLVYPFPRDLSVRYSKEDGLYERNVPIETFGGKAGLKPIPIGVVLMTEYDDNAVWDPKILTPGQGIMELIPHTIPRNFNTAFSLKVLNTAVSDAIILKSPRGDAGNFAIELLSFF